MVPLKDKDKKTNKPSKKTAGRSTEKEPVRSAQKKKTEPKPVPAKAKKSAKEEPEKGRRETPKGKLPVTEPEAMGSSFADRMATTTAGERPEVRVAYPQSTIEGVSPHPVAPANPVVAVQATKYELTQPDRVIEPVYPEEAQTDLPPRYNETRLVLLVRDPEWIYMYWDVADADREVIGMLPERFMDALVVRLHDISGVEEFNGVNSLAWYEIPITGGALNWYVHLPYVDREWLGELGVLNEQGEFIQICRSNRVRTPRNFISEESADVEWATVSEDLRELLARSADVAVSSSLSSGEAVRQISRRLRIQLEEQEVASGGISGSLRPRGSQFMLGAQRGVGLARDLPLQVRTELILSGKTAPDAKLTVQGHPVILRADGTFTLRFELPDGEQVLAVRAATQDEAFEREITPVVRKETH